MLKNLPEACYAITLTNETFAFQFFSAQSIDFIISWLESAKREGYTKMEIPTKIGELRFTK